MREFFVAFISGVLFAVGLAISGMTIPAKVIGFLDVFGNWDPTLLFVMVGAIAVHLISYRLVPAMPTPIYAGTFRLPTKRDIDRRLIIGSAVFGTGWGMLGYCPGPALTSLGTGFSGAWIFVIAMAVGMYLGHFFEGSLDRRKKP